MCGWGLGIALVELKISQFVFQGFLEKVGGGGDSFSSVENTRMSTSRLSNIPIKAMVSGTCISICLIAKVRINSKIPKHDNEFVLS